ncbi:hypothetical protein GCM10023145_00820 [Angustibacter luteus]
MAITLDRYGFLYPGDVHQFVDRLGEAATRAGADYLRTREAARVVDLGRRGGLTPSDLGSCS